MKKNKNKSIFCKIEFNDAKNILTVLKNPINKRGEVC